MKDSKQKTKRGRTIGRLRAHCGPYSGDICPMTGVSDYQLSEIILEEGFGYLRQIGKLSPTLEAWGNCSRPFWNWWKMMWYSLDATFVARYRNRKVPLVAYVEFHRMEMDGKYPDEAVLACLVTKEVAA